MIKKLEDYQCYFLFSIFFCSSNVIFLLFILPLKNWLKNKANNSDWHIKTYTLCYYPFAFKRSQTWMCFHLTVLTPVHISSHALSNLKEETLWIPISNLLILSWLQVWLSRGRLEKIRGWSKLLTRWQNQHLSQSPSRFGAGTLGLESGSEETNTIPQ